jgi:signal transduction histidine kinase
MKGIPVEEKRARMRTDRASIVGWSLFAFTLITNGLFLAVRDADFAAAIAIAVWLSVSGLVGALVASRRPDNPCGWLLLAMSVLLAISVLTSDYAQQAVEQADRGFVVQLGAWLSSWTSIPGFASLVILLLLFPTGSPPSPRWRPLLWIGGGATALEIVVISLRPGSFDAVPGLRNPLGIEAESMLSVLRAAAEGALLLFTVATVVSLIVRYRRAGGTEREQMKWIAFDGILLALAGVFAATSPQSTNELSFYVPIAALIGLPVAIGIAILRYRLFDIDTLINRTIVYFGLTACVAALYVAVVAAFGGLFQDRVSVAVSLLATAVIAVVFAPLRSTVQRFVNRVMYGYRDDPYAALSDLGKQLEGIVEPDAAMPAVAEAVAHSLKLPYVALRLTYGEGIETVAEFGDPRGPTTTLPLTHHGEIVGELVVSPRGPREELTPADLRTLNDIARQVGPAARAVRLAHDLQRSRESLVRTREEERRRLRRDLHDGLGPELAGVVLGLGGVENLLRGDPSQAEELVARIKGQLQGAISSVRSIVQDLAPPELDQLGFMAAIRERAERFSISDQGMEVRIEGPDRLPPLPAATEVAAYRIVMEALTNAARHSGGRCCTVHVTFNGSLELDIADDGSGLPDTFRAGVGITSMRERAEELGGTCRIDSVPGGGTRVLARLPAGSA